MAHALDPSPTLRFREPDRSLDLFVRVPRPSHSSQTTLAECKHVSTIFIPGSPQGRNRALTILKVYPSRHPPTFN